MQSKYTKTLDDRFSEEEARYALAGTNRILRIKPINFIEKMSPEDKERFLDQEFAKNTTNETKDAKS